MNYYLDKNLSCTWQQALAYLRSHFQEVAQGQCHLWVNPANLDPFANVPLVEKNRIRVPIRHPRFDMRLAPYLVKLDLSQPAEAEVFEKSVEIAWNAWTKESLAAFCGQPISGWLTTKIPPKTLAMHWAQHCHLHRCQQLTKLLRFHDPGVREWLWPTLSKLQREALLGPADTIVAIGRGHQLQCLTRPSGSDPTAQFPPLVLENAQWDQVDDYAIVHAAWVLWTNESENPINYSPGWERDVLKSLRQATGYGIRDRQDRELFSLHALRLGADFHSHERMQPVWNRTCAGDCYGRALEEIFACPVQQFH
jgi:hypothetical protein